jgi:hypothetical protein
LFLEFSAGEAGGLLINGNPGDRSVSLRLLPAGGEVRFADLEAVALPWDMCGQVRSVIEGPERNGWAIAHWLENSRQVSGVAVQVSGGCARMAAAMSRATTTRWRRAFGSRQFTGYSLPILRPRSSFTACKRERETLEALTTVLSAKPKLRPLLDDPVRMRRLATDLSAGLQPQLIDGGARRAAAVARQGGWRCSGAARR